MQRPIMESEVHIMLRDTQPSQSVAINVHSNKSIELERQITANQLLGGTTISFMNLSYNISGQESKSILKDVSGFFPCGKLSAILGSSGAGKTSLLNLVACRLEKNNKNQVCGQRFVNGYIYDYEKFNNFAAYVMQNDILLESQTPREAITFVAQLKYRDELTVNQKVSDTLKLLQLNTCQNTFIGGLFRKGLSGGEKKRLSIAIELVSDPHCLILDEPTSGLDSYTAFHIIHELKKLALNNNKTIILTIHQPSNDIYNEIDHLIVMSYGSFIFQGSREDAEFYFNKINLKCPQRTNPPDHFIQLTHSQIAQNYLLEQYQNYIQPQINKIINQQSRNNYYVKQNETSSGRKILVLFKRNYQNYVRNVFLLATRVLITFFLSLSFGYIYWKIGENNGMPQESFYLVGSIFFLTTTVMFSNALGILLVFDQEREVFIREEASKLYGIMVYFVSKQFLELPDNIILTLIQCSIAYWMMGYNDLEWWMFFQTCAIFTTLAMCGNSIGIMCGCVMKQKALALSVTPFILIPFIMYGGYLANQDNYYPWIGWIQYINPLKYAFEGELTNETYKRFYLVDPLKKYNLSLGVWQCIGLNFLCFLLYRILALILLYRLRHKLQ